VKLDQRQTPLVEALQQCSRDAHAAFYAPGHKRGQGISAVLAECLGADVFQADLPELPELDNLFAPTGAIATAQALAADAFGAEQTWFLVNGSTCGLVAGILATCRPGDKIVLPRNVHQSIISGLILAGAMPIFVVPAYDPLWDLPLGVTPEAVAQALHQHPDAKAVLIVSPTYHGICADVAAIAQRVHEYGIPLLVDEAHGPHFAFHPDLPLPALKAGADFVVQSTHKVLSAMTQASMLHVQGSRVDRDRITQSLQLLQSTSPSYLLLASLDAARQQMAVQGEALMTQTLKLSRLAQRTLQSIAKLGVLEFDKPSPGFTALDATRLTLNIANLGVSGFVIDDWLRQQRGVIAEYPSLRHLTFILSLGNTRQDIQLLIDACQDLTTFSQSSQGLILRRLQCLSRQWQQFGTSKLVMTPRQAFDAQTQVLPVEAAIAQISAELICPYPPGIPVLLPGERITSAAIGYLQQVIAAGGLVTGCHDPNLQTIRVVSSIHR
jgi:arginine/lysine/ornithine decarboxylase